MTTEEYINKNNLLADIRRAASRSSLGETTESYLDWKEVVSFIVEAPVEDVAPVKRGKWIDHIEKPEWLEDDVEVYYECSCCGIKNFAETNYCPCCGAKMLEVED